MSSLRPPSHGHDASRRLALCLLAWLALVAGPAITWAAHQPDVVVVAGVKSPVDKLTSRDLRRLYMGLPPETAPAGTRALFNDCEAEVRSAFLQAYLFMTEAHYERILAGRRYRSGESPLPRGDSTVDVSARVKRDPLLITFMPRGHAASDPGLKVLQVQ